MNDFDICSMQYLHLQPKPFIFLPRTASLASFESQREGEVEVEVNFQ